MAVVKKADRPIKERSCYFAAVWSPAPAGRAVISTECTSKIQGFSLVLSWRGVGKALAGVRRAPKHPIPSHREFLSKKHRGAHDFLAYKATFLIANSNQRSRPRAPTARPKPGLAPARTPDWRPGARTAGGENPTAQNAADDPPQRPPPPTHAPAHRPPARRQPPGQPHAGFV